jgi:ribonuclease Z
MSLIMLGTGNTLGGVQRVKSSTAVFAANQIFLVDCGCGVIQRLLASGIMPNHINKIFFTHHHADHNGGFIDFFVTSSLNRLDLGRQLPIEAYGPTNTKEIISKMRESIESDVSSRKPNSADWSKIIFNELNNGTIYKKDGLEVTVFLVDHGPYKPAVGYKFEYNGKKIVFSGDTSPNDNVKFHSKKADILIHEAYNAEWIKTSIKQNPSDEQTMRAVMTKHTSTLEAAEIAREAEVGHLVLTHHIPLPIPLTRIEKQYIRGISKIFKGKISMGRDLMEIS